jgi:hypothetical protein
MGRAFGFVTLLIAVGAGLYLYTRQVQSVTSVGSNPQTTVDVTGVRNDLLAIANAERQYFASNGKYVSLEELRTGGGMTIPTRPNYSYSAETTDAAFKIIAVYSGPDPKAPKRITIDDTMSLVTEP